MRFIARVLSIGQRLFYVHFIALLRFGNKNFSKLLQIIKYSEIFKIYNKGTEFKDRQIKLRRKIK